jgi:hypothetical protein
MKVNQREQLKNSKQFVNINLDMITLLIQMDKGQLIKEE